MLCKKNIVAKSKEVKTGSNLAESSKEGYGPERAVLPMIKIDFKITSRPRVREGTYS
jgi:hypothetical protein